ncbi:hypothetical protein [Crocosphaera chwakensis]|uniref:Uncharacterized protein n=1 Tax=Crocosphaera chwakensis CCY0110 TaxID=391612 RepID=A3IMJ1_9CHRO|nr:hypothetical protein [Crocosphaera chwakensis]EAZ92360.1 hypothetical protein CY0110_28414 [Crocosphaera chwakensis CCY0110]
MIATEKLNHKTERKEELNGAVAEKVDQKNIAITKEVLKSQTTLTQEKTSRTINQFTPHCDASNFYGKLRAVAYQELEEDQDN